ncbi:helix-turn-helix domain-containing protein [Pseudaminobacter sp. NGMCC 1.201702]|uniref:helix-turn-helix domain-containing protein n=1 Tax=Pseudaminobacter sp. NGMCC 1.201702 TaxID=3391825 RepID=UPI0039EDF1BC
MRKEEKKAAARLLRARGFSLAAIASRLGVTRTSVHYWLRGRRAAVPRLPAPVAKPNTAVRYMPVNGGASTICFHQPVSLPRVTFIDGPQAGARAEGAAA